ncbi:Protein phosphatase 2C 7 [Coemansia sp. RSA 2671]|nr:Protein phosphatase 2C 7 [Coemansia sp. RSA 2675]KAJ2342170.1 Protein phosphatase 2C 7 [Coemansia sp. RSA 2671]
MPSVINAALGPRFQAVLASAWISKHAAAKYVQDYVRQVQAESKASDNATREPIAFAPPIQVQVLNVAEGSSYEALDAINGGEDSLFHARIKQNLVYGVADGVGGWNESGIDPSIFSRTLTAFSADAAQRTFLLHDSDETDPKDIMRRAFAGMRFDGVPAYGSATELVMGLSLATGRLRTAQLGDSTYVVLDGQQRAKFVAAEQQHRFNMPYQLTIPPIDDSGRRVGKKEGEEESAQFFRPRVQDEGSAVAKEARRLVDEDDFADLSSVGFDTPADAREDSHMLAHNEVVVAATDGLFDNVRVEEVERLAERFMQAINSKKQGAKSSHTADLFGGLAYSVAAQAVANYIQNDLRSPFAERAKLAGYNFSGGKPDDVTVMLAWVRETARVHAEEQIREMQPKL